MHVPSPSSIAKSRLVDLLAVERKTDRAEEQSCFSVVGGGRVDDNVASGNHFWWVAIREVSVVRQYAFVGLVTHAS